MLLAVAPSHTCATWSGSREVRPFSACKHETTCHLATATLACTKRTGAACVRVTPGRLFCRAYNRLRVDGAQDVPAAKITKLASRTSSNQSFWNAGCYFTAAHTFGAAAHVQCNVIIVYACSHAFALPAILHCK